MTPALAAANNGNWQTAHRWAGFLSGGGYRVRLAADWQGGEEAMMIALHARRSAAALAEWRARHPDRALLLVLTGTDLYRDIAFDASAQRSLELADRLVVLNELGIQALPTAQRAKAIVILQSCPARRPAAKTQAHLRALAVGHLREEKGPRTLFEAVRLLSRRHDILFDEIGAALDPALADEAATLAAASRQYRWLGPLSHGATLARIRGAHVLVHASRIEGGAHVVIEAVRCGTPVIASHIDGNVGLLGADYRGYFPVDDAAELSRLLERARDDATMLPALKAQCDARVALFEPARERSTLLSTIAAMLG